MEVEGGRTEGSRLYSESASRREEIESGASVYLPTCIFKGYAKSGSSSHNATLNIIQRPYSPHILGQILGSVTRVQDAGTYIVSLELGGMRLPMVTSGRSKVLYYPCYHCCHCRRDARDDDRAE